MGYQISTGFDYYTTATQWWDSNPSGVVTINTASARFTGTHSQGASMPQNSKLVKNLSSNFVTLILGIAVKFTGLPTANDLFMGVQDNATFQTGLVLSTAGALQFCRGTAATLIGSASSNGLIVAGVWNYIEMQVTISNTVGTAQAWVNGVQVINSTGLNNRNSANAFANQLAIGEMTNNPGPVPILYDDMYCLDTSTTTPNTVLGDSRIITIMPSGVGAFSQFTPNGATPNWNCVKEIPPDDNTTFVADSVTNDRDSYDYDTVSFTGNATLVVPWPRLTKDDVVTRTAEVSVRNGGIDTFGPAITVASSYAYVVGGVFLTNPNGGGAFAASDINNTEFGLVLLSFTNETFSDTFTLTDALTKTLDQDKTFSDTLTMTDAVTKTLA